MVDQARWWGRAASPPSRNLSIRVRHPLANLGLWGGIGHPSAGRTRVGMRPAADLRPVECGRSGRRTPWSTSTLNPHGCLGGADSSLGLLEGTYKELPNLP
jgi:hypothetical protein